MSCSSKGLAPIDEEEDRVRFEEFYSEINRPVFYLIGATCTYRANQNKWPHTPTMTGPDTLFSSFETKVSDNIYINTFVLTNSSLTWAIHQNYTKVQNSSVCESKIIMRSPSSENETSFNLSLQAEELEKLNESNPEAFEELSVAMSAFFYPFVSLVEPSSQNPSASNFDTLMDRYGGYVALGSIAAVCALFDVDTNECIKASGGLSSSKAMTSTSSSKVDEIKKIKKDEMEHKLKQKLEEY